MTWVRTYVTVTLIMVLEPIWQPMKADRSETRSHSSSRKAAGLELKTWRREAGGDLRWWVRWRACDAAARGCPAIKPCHHGDCAASFVWRRNWRGSVEWSGIEWSLFSIDSSLTDRQGGREGEGEGGREPGRERGSEEERKSVREGERKRGREGERKGGRREDVHR